MADQQPTRRYTGITAGCEAPTNTAIHGFETGYTPPKPRLGGPCVDCCAAPATVGSFTGEAVCDVCDQRRAMLVGQLAAIIGGATPEEIIRASFDRPAFADSELERVELRDHIDLLLAMRPAAKTVQATPSEPKALNKMGAARCLGVSVDFFDDHIEHELRCIRRGRRKFYPVKELERWLEQEAERVEPKSRFR